MGRSWRVFIGFRGCKGLQPSRSIRAIDVFIEPWRAPVPRRRARRWGLCFAGIRHGAIVEGLYRFPRLQGTAALQVNNGYQKLNPQFAIRIPKINSPLLG